MTITGAASVGTSTRARTGAVHRGSSTPASIAAATGAGMAATARPRAGNSPAATMSSPHSANAPTAAGQPPGTGPVATSSAAPGVDQAIAIGIRCRSPSQVAQIPAATLTVSSPEAAWASLAPTARSPASTTVNELAKPTTAVTTPASTGCSRSPTTASLTPTPTAGARARPSRRAQATRPVAPVPFTERGPCSTIAV